MKNLSFIILGTIAVVLIGLAMWQLMWMSDVVDNYDATKSYNVPDLKNNNKDNGNNAVIAGQPVEEEARSIIDSPGINLDKEDQSAVVPDRPSTLDSKEVKSVSVKKRPVITDSPDSMHGDRKIISSSNNEKVTIREDDRTVSIDLKGYKPSSPRRQTITETPISPGKPLNIPAQSVTQHATSTSPY